MSSWMSETLHFDVFLLSKSYKVLAKKVKKSYLSLHWRVIAEFEEKLTCGCKHHMRNLVNSHSTSKKSDNFFSMGSSFPEYTRYEQQKYRKVIFEDIEKSFKIWINPVVVPSKMAWGIGWASILALKCLKKCILMGSFCSKALNVSTRKCYKNYVSWQ